MAANTYTLISSNVLTATSTSVTFSSIPQTYTDLVLKCSARNTGASTWYTADVSFNGVVTGGTYSQTQLYGFATTATSTLSSNINNIQTTYIGGGATTANTFAAIEFYIPSYTAVQNKQFNFSVAGENNSATQNYIESIAGLSRTTAAITSITLSMTTFAIGSSFYLYGISKS